MPEKQKPDPYSKVARSTWADRKFQGLSERARLLWFYLLTGPRCTAIPGLLPDIGLGFLGDAMTWNPAQVRKHWNEIERADMAIADWSHRVIYLPRAFVHNEPANPNVITSWRRIPLPQCPLVVGALWCWRGYLKTKTESAWVDAFDRAFRQRFPEALAEGLPKGLPEGFAKTGSGTGSGTQIDRSYQLGPVEPVENRSPDPLVQASDRREAFALRRNYCPHNPECRSAEICVEKIAGHLARQRQSVKPIAH